MEIKTGQVIGGFRIVEEVGRGGFAAVYKAVNEINDEVVALKIPFEGFAGKFSQESLTGKLKHPNIIRALGGDLNHAPPYLVLEYVESGLREKIGRLSRKESARVVRGVLEAMIHAEENGIVHRDLKPSNILLTDESRPKICDFGLAEKINELALSFDKTAEKAAGTLDYMAPEVKKGNQSTRQSDIYSFGIVLYELYNHEVPDRILKSTGNKKLDNVIKKCLQTNPNERYSSFKELKPELKDAFVKKKTKNSQENSLKFERTMSKAIKHPSTEPEPAYQESSYQAANPRNFSRKAVIAGTVGSLLLGSLTAAGIFARQAYLDWRKSSEETVEKTENSGTKPRPRARDWTEYWTRPSENPEPIPSTEELLAEEMKKKGYTNLDDFLRAEEMEKQGYTDAGQYWLREEKKRFSLRIPWRKDYDYCEYYFSGPGILDRMSSDLMRQISTDLLFEITLNESGWAARELEKLKITCLENRHNGRYPKIWDSFEKVGSGIPRVLEKEDVTPGYEFFVRHEDKLYRFEFKNISKKENWGNFVTFERREISRK